MLDEIICTKAKMGVVIIMLILIKVVHSQKFSNISVARPPSDCV